MSGGKSELSLPSFFEAILLEEYRRMNCSSSEDQNESSSPERGIKLSPHENDVEEFRALSGDKSSADSDEEVVSIQKPAAKTRSKYTPAQQKEIIRIFNSHLCQNEAMKKINDIAEYKHVYKRKVLRWISSNKTMGRPICREFENEVLEEVKNHWKDHMPSYNKFVATCAVAVFNREYWSEEDQVFVKKWTTEKLTRKLKFTTKWIGGLLKRGIEAINPIHHHHVEDNNRKDRLHGVDLFDGAYIRVNKNLLGGGSDQSSSCSASQYQSLKQSRSTLSMLLEF